MAVEKWVTIKSEWCELLEQDVEFMELRIYPSDVMPDTAQYKVKARRCSTDVTCNMAGFPCKWSFTNPDNDPFREFYN